MASQTFQSTIHTTPMGERASMLGQINLRLMEELGCSKRLTGDCTIKKIEYPNNLFIRNSVVTSTPKNPKKYEFPRDSSKANNVATLMKMVRKMSFLTLLFKPNNKVAALMKKSRKTDFA